MLLMILIIKYTNMITIRIQSWDYNFEDFDEQIYVLKEKWHIEKVKSYVSKLKDKYGNKYNYYKAQDAIKEYIIRTLHWICMNDRGEKLIID